MGKQNAAGKSGAASGKPGPRQAPPRVWRGVARLAGDALLALEVNDTEEVFQCLRAIRAMATCADEDLN